MQCEICGRETDKTVRILLDGSHLIACEECSSRGTIEKERKTFFKQKTKETKGILEIEEEIVAGFGKKIRKAREEKGWTIEELGKKTFEKASFLHRIEAESVKPSVQLAKKIEAVFGIKIMEEE